MGVIAQFNSCGFLDFPLTQQGIVARPSLNTLFRSLQQIHIPGFCYGLGATSHVQFAVYVVGMSLGDAHRDYELLRYLAIGHSSSDELKHLDLAICERIA